MTKFRMDAFNAFNHINAGNPGGNIESRISVVRVAAADRATLRTASAGILPSRSVLIPRRSRTNLEGSFGSPLFFSSQAYERAAANSSVG